MMTKLIKDTLRKFIHRAVWGGQSAQAHSVIGELRSLEATFRNERYSLLSKYHEAEMAWANTRVQKAESKAKAAGREAYLAGELARAKEVEACALRMHNEDLLARLHELKVELEEEREKVKKLEAALGIEEGVTRLMEDQA